MPSKGTRRLLPSLGDALAKRMENRSASGRQSGTRCSNAARTTSGSAVPVLTLSALDDSFKLAEHRAAGTA